LPDGIFEDNLDLAIAFAHPRSDTGVFKEIDPVVHHREEGAPTRDGVAIHILVCEALVNIELLHANLETEFGASRDPFVGS
jgi:hypothetical protein